MTIANDWKEKYQNLLKTLETKESEWLSLESMLRKAVSRLSIAGKGQSTVLDQQLTHILYLSRDKKDDQLAQALETLAATLLARSEPAAEQKSANFDLYPVLQKLVGSIQMKSHSPYELQLQCECLLKAVSDGQSIETINQHIETLCQLVHTPPAPEPSYKLEIDSSIFDALSNLAQEQEDSNTAHTVQSTLLDGIASTDWPGIFEQTVSSATEKLHTLNQDKQSLENFIQNVTSQLEQVAQMISQGHEAHLSGQEDTLSLHSMVKKGVADIDNEVHRVSNIEQLKSVFTSNIDSIRESVGSFVERSNERYDENAIRNEALTHKLSQMEEETAELQQKLAENREKLLHDTLTGVKSRLAYDEHMTQELSSWQRYGSTFSYVILDIDHFKLINDQFGHSAGDKALKIIAQLMRKQIRKSDNIFRIGGEEFVIILTNTTADKAESLVQKLRDEVASTEFHFNQERLVLTLSAGITQIAQNDTAESLYERADSAMYRSKHAGRNCQFVA